MYTFDRGNKSLQELLEDMINCSLKKFYGGIYTFEDLNRTIKVDINTGIVSKYNFETNKETLFIEGKDSLKNDGRIYATIEYMSGGKVCRDPIGQHRIINMLAHKAQYDHYRYVLGKIPETCHINGCPWDNRADNLEWGSHFENARQGKIVASLEHHFPGVYTTLMIKGPCTAIKVDQGISNSYIQQYIDNVCGGKNVFKLKRNEEYIKLNIVTGFVAWLYKQGYWK